MIVFVQEYFRVSFYEEGRERRNDRFLIFSVLFPEVPNHHRLKQKLPCRNTIALTDYSTF